MTELREESFETSKLIAVMCDRFSGELGEMQNVGDRHVSSFIRKRLLLVDQINTTSNEDCLLLYLLIRHFGRRHVFEVGTNIGTSAVIMNEAARRNGGVLTTTDPFDLGHVSPWSGIRFMRGTAETALYVLKSEGHRIDFCFFDWPPDTPTLALLRDVMTEDAILATHDYHAADVKGGLVADALTGAGLCEGRIFFPPSSEQDRSADGTAINMCTAFWIPRSLL